MPKWKRNRHNTATMPKRKGNRHNTTKVPRVPRCLPSLITYEHMPPDELRLLRLRVLKMFEDKVYITAGSMGVHYRIKYGINLMPTQRKCDFFVKLLPDHLLLSNYKDFSGDRCFLTLAFRPSLPLSPTDDPVSLTTLYVRIIRLCTMAIKSPVLLLQLYELAYGKLHSHQFPLPCAAASSIFINTWADFVSWAKCDRPKKLPALYANLSDEKLIGMINFVGPEEWDRWTWFVGTENGTVCAERLLDAKPSVKPEPYDPDFEPFNNSMSVLSFPLSAPETECVYIKPEPSDEISDMRLEPVYKPQFQPVPTMIPEYLLDALMPEERQALEANGNWIGRYV